MIGCKATCAIDEANGRPLIGMMKICLHGKSGEDLNEQKQILHHLYHILLISPLHLHRLSSQHPSHHSNSDSNPTTTHHPHNHDLLSIYSPAVQSWNPDYTSVLLYKSHLQWDMETTMNEEDISFVTMLLMNESVWYTVNWDNYYWAKQSESLSTSTQRRQLLVAPTSLNATQKLNILNSINYYRSLVSDGVSVTRWSGVFSKNQEKLRWDEALYDIAMSNAAKCIYQTSNETIRNSQFRSKTTLTTPGSPQNIVGETIINGNRGYLTSYSSIQSGIISVIGNNWKPNVKMLVCVRERERREVNSFFFFFLYK
ncbi:hypothetical protein RFI_11827 [Reticulomyxa filosa]|uniref:Uncharacterized protein n=1 Tax=Reticulomyxa filosa TaxID=46433 RepID=X6NHU3_RETFI|nr:hypothetical protein RFI_11827 [Reticulomyxa filosa]|eukprot:ETO25309.1 hypothetical protein RFI_11827 [Reticulomyxa filosa]